MVVLRVNGRDHSLDITAHRTLLRVLRDDLHLRGTKDPCERGSCGGCTVLVDGRAVYSCLLLAVTCAGRQITTIEGLDGGALHPIQRAFVEHDALQCGYCTPAQILTAKALLGTRPEPSEAEVREAMSGVLCRCGSYPKILRAVLTAAGAMRAHGG
ncbi:MAG: (2Fe-2S)-binding protein [Armatimonadota bacterium]|nr:(2Fe-2S)-binding protein [Armatimonadota bacterium]MDR5697410.1 (2Fe-2S)-binding protein [Armatimonadota bacterium]